MPRSYAKIKCVGDSMFLYSMKFYPLCERRERMEQYWTSDYIKKTMEPQMEIILRIVL